MTLRLDAVTLLCVDCLDANRAQKAIEVCTAQITFGAVKLLTSIDHPGSTPIAPIRSLNEYSTFMLNEVHRHVDTSHMLVVQYDGYVLNADAWDDAFLRYDYIGAPWPNGTVGNGGFSLRSKLLMAHVASYSVPLNGSVRGLVNEDGVICQGLRPQLEANFLFAPLDVALRFSVERGDFPMANVFGFHGFGARDRWRQQQQQRGVR